MELTVEQILEAITKTPTLVDGLLPKLVELEPVKKVIENRAESIFKVKIDEEISKTHSRYDDDMMATLGERPAQKEDGTKEKTHEKIKTLFGELKELRTKKDSLSKDAEVQRLMGELEKAKQEGGGKFIQEQFEQAKAEWTKKEQDLLKQIQDKDGALTVGQIKNIVATGFAGLKLNPDISDTIKNVILQNEEQKIIQNAKIENGKVVFMNAEGKPLLNPTTYEPMTITEVLSTSEAVKEITLKENAGGGGGADPVVKGALKTITVEGKDSRKLELPAGSFKTKKEFIDVAEKALIDSGITRRDADWDTLKNEAYKSYNVSELPME